MRWHLSQGRLLGCKTKQAYENNTIQHEQARTPQLLVVPVGVRDRVRAVEVETKCAHTIEDALHVQREQAIPSLFRKAVRCTRLCFGM